MSRKYFEEECDSTSYYKGVPSDIRAKVLERDGYKCQRCGYAFLEIHHIDGNRENNDLDNLVTLCRKCHFEIHAMEYLSLPSYYQQERTFIKTVLSKYKIIEELIENILNDTIDKININIKIELVKKSKRSRSNITIEIENDSSVIDNSKIQYNLLAQLRSKIIKTLRECLSSHYVAENIKDILTYELTNEIAKELELERFSITISERRK